MSRAKQHHCWSGMLAIGALVLSPRSHGQGGVECRPDRNLPRD
jgi:hypothetical protein